MWIIFSVDKLVVHQKTFQLNDFRADAKRVVAVIQILSKKFFSVSVFFLYLPAVVPGISVKSDEKQECST